MDEQNQRGDERVLLILFGLLLAGVVFILYSDLRNATDPQSAPFNLPLLTSRPDAAPPLIRPARDQDQIRRYSPQTSVNFGVGRQAKLPGVSGNIHQLLKGNMTFHDAGDGVISAIGMIAVGTFSSFEDFIEKRDQTSPVKQLFLHSPGGSVADAIAMSRLIRENNISTHIVRHGYCASSCPLVFSGGIKRQIGKPAALGVHQMSAFGGDIASVETGIATVQAITAEAQNLLVDMGVDPRAWIFAMSTPKDQLYLFNEEEMDELNWFTK